MCDRKVGLWWDGFLPIKITRFFLAVQSGTFQNELQLFFREDGLK